MKRKLMRRTGIALADLLLVVVAAWCTTLVKEDFVVREVGSVYLQPFLVFLVIWLATSLYFNKFKSGDPKTIRSLLTSIVFCNFVILAMVTILIYSFNLVSLSRLIVFGTILLATCFEALIGLTYVSIKNSPFLVEWIGPEFFNGTNQNGNGKTKSSHPNPAFHSKNPASLMAAITEESGENAAAWIARHIDVSAMHTLILSTTTRFNIENQPDKYFRGVVNLKRINDIQRINKFFETINAKLAVEGLFIGCGETYSLRKGRILKNYPAGLNYLIYGFDFLWRRVFPKLKLTKKIYFLFSKGENRVMSRTETLGRLYSCGFEVMVEENMDNLFYWVAKKISKPVFDYSPSYGMLIRLRRIGKHGKPFNVYKFRTMHAYAEYVQPYVYSNNHFDVSGKFKDDYRVTTLGRFLRRTWLDELPQLINLVKGNMKIFGVRPISQHIFDLYHKDIQQTRIKYKPGLIPPFYSQFPTPQSLEEVQQNEIRYLNEYEKRPWQTDVKYFSRALYNIVVKKARSK